MKEKEVYEQQVEKQLKEWAADIEKLQSHLNNLESDALDTYTKPINEVKELYNKAVRVLSEMKNTGVNVGVELKTTLDGVLNELQKGLQQAAGKIESNNND